MATLEHLAANEGLIVSHTMYQSNGFRESTPPQNRQLNVLISDSKRLGDDFEGGGTFQDYLRNTFCAQDVVTTLEHLAANEGLVVIPLEP